MAVNGFGVLTVFLLINFELSKALPSARQYNSSFNTDLHIAEAGYPVEVHHVTTRDGYVLRMHRIPHGRNDIGYTEQRAPVFLMHGLTGVSNAFISIGPELAPAYNLADAGFDVWMGNARGNKESRSHTSLNPDDDQDKLLFFDFTWDEIATIDLPTMLDYVLETTGKSKIHYIGHSQGGTVFLALNSVMPEYNAKFVSAHLLAGVGYQDYFPDTMLSGFASYTNLIYNLAVNLGFVELFPPGFNLTDLPDFLPFPRGANDCNTELGPRGICDFIGVQNMLQRDTEADDELAFDLENFGGAAVKQYAHYGQNIAAKLFRRWDHGSATNILLYGTETPPLYNLSLITTQTTMHYSVADNLLDERDVLAMAADMPNANVRRVARDTFTHTDFVIGSDAKALLTDYIIEEIWNEINDMSEADTEDVDSGTIDQENVNSAHLLTVSGLTKIYLSFTILSLTWLL